MKIGRSSLNCFLIVSGVAAASVFTFNFNAVEYYNHSVLRDYFRSKNKYFITEKKQDSEHKPEDRVRDHVTVHVKKEYNISKFWRVCSKLRNTLCITRQLFYHED